MSFSGWVDQLLSGGRKPQGHTKRIGVFSAEVKKRLIAEGVDPGSGVFRIEDSVILKSMRESHRSGRNPRKPPTIEDIKMLQYLVRNPT